MIKKASKPKLSFLDRKETTFLGKAGNVLIAFVIMFVTMLFVNFLYSWLFSGHIEFPGFEQITFGPIWVYDHPFLVEIFLSVLLAPLIEELFFRHFPIQIIKATGKKELLWPTILFTSALFGIMHDGYPSILLQGVGGLLLSIVYIKNNYSYWSSVALHAMWNLSLLLITIWL